VNQFPDSKVYIIPKKNVTLEQGAKWTETLGEFLFIDNICPAHQCVN
jgi:hypothetical protein